MSAESFDPRREARHRRGRIFRWLCVSAVWFAGITLVVLLVKVTADGLAWLSLDFLRNYPSRIPARAGIRSAILGTLWMMALTGAVSFPLGVLILPVVIIASREALRAVPPSLREASYGLGATRWQTIRYHVLPVAFPGILTGTILSLSRAIGETAPLIMIGALTFIAFAPTSPLDPFTVLPIQIFNWTAKPQADFHSLAAAAIIVLLVILLLMNATAILLRNKYRQEL
ncbi:MAG: ABC transporter permease subunit [Gemmatimonadales bacterium]